MQLVSKISNLCGPDPRTFQTDRRTTCNLNTALCTIVHRAVKKIVSRLSATIGSFFEAKNVKLSTATPLLMALLDIFSNSLLVIELLRIMFPKKWTEYFEVARLTGRPDALMLN